MHLLEWLYLCVYLCSMFFFERKQLTTAWLSSALGAMLSGFISLRLAQYAYALSSLFTLTMAVTYFMKRGKIQ